MEKILRFLPLHTKELIIPRRTRSEYSQKKERLMVEINGMMRVIVAVRSVHLDLGVIHINLLKSMRV